MKVDEYPKIVWTHCHYATDVRLVVTTVAACARLKMTTHTEGLVLERKLGRDIMGNDIWVEVTRSIEPWGIGDIEHLWKAAYHDLMQE